MSLKTERLIYTARNFDTSLTDVVATIRRNGTQVATNVALSHVGLGRYELVLSPATLTGYGGAGFYDFYVNSATKDAPAVASRWILANDSDDLRAGQVAIEAKIDIIDTNLDSVKVTVEDTNAKVSDGSYGLSALKALIDAVQNTVSNISNTTRQNIAVPSEMISDDVDPTSYRIPIRLFDTAGNMEDPDSNAVAVSVQDESGADRTSYLVGYVSGPVNATRTAQGVYHIDVEIPANADKEQLNFFFSYTENAIPLSGVRTTRVISNIDDVGFALESTSQDILTDTADMQPRVVDIQTKVNDATYGLAALKALIDTLDSVADSIKVDTTAIEATINNATYGLANIKTVLDTKASQTSVTAITTNLDNNVKGAGFDNSTDSLREISNRTYRGGGAF